MAIRIMVRRVRSDQECECDMKSSFFTDRTCIIIARTAARLSSERTGRDISRSSSPHHHMRNYFALAAVSATMLLNPAARFLSAAAFSVSRS